MWYTVHCQLVPVGTATASYLYCFFMSAGTAMCGYCHVWVLPPLYIVCYGVYYYHFILYAMHCRYLHAWVLLLLYIVCSALWVLPMRGYCSCFIFYAMHCGYCSCFIFYAMHCGYCRHFIFYAMHCGYCHMCGYCHHFIFYAMHCRYCHMCGYCRCYIILFYAMRCGLGFLIRSYGAPNGTERYSAAQCYDKTWATLAQSKGPVLLISSSSSRC